MTIYLIEDFEKILASAATGVAKVKIGNLNMIDGGDGKVLSSYVSSYPAMLTSIFDSVTLSTGIDIQKAISGRSTTTANEEEVQS